MTALRGRGGYSFAFDAAAPAEARRSALWLEHLRSWGTFAALMAIWVTMCAWTVSYLITVPRSLATVAGRKPSQVPAMARTQWPVRQAREP